MDGIVRKANCAERASFARMIMLSAPYFKELFGAKAEKMFEALFCIKGTLFSSELVKALYFDHTPAGMILSYDFETGRRFSLKTGLCFFRYAACQMLCKFPVFLRLNKRIGKLNPGDYYISNLAVFSPFRSRGGGQLLMKSAEEEARLRGMKYLVLDVERENERAIGLYTHCGFEIYRSFDVNIGRKTILHFFRMKKLLN